MARRHAPRSRAVSHRQTTWVGQADQTFIGVGTNAKVIVSNFDPQANSMLAPTIVRTRGEVTVVATTLTVDVDIVGAFGLAVVTDRAFAAGQASVPGPWTDSDWGGWFVWQSFAVAYEIGSEIGVVNAGHTMIVDSKAMRKVKDDETIILVAESQSSGFRIAMPLRLLLKLS